MPLWPRISLLLCLLTGAAQAGDPPRRIPLDPTTTRIDFRAYALGVLPLDGTFSRFDGTLALDADPARGCRIALRVEVASLRVDDPVIQADMLSANLLDAAQYPVLAFEGACRGDSLVGDLSLHGVRREVALAVTRGSGEVIVAGSLLRTEWGITGRPMLAGRTIRLRLAARQPR